MKFLKNLLRNRKGAAMVEYGLLIAGVALVAAAALSIFGHKTNDLIAVTAGVLPGAHDTDNGPIVSTKIIETSVDPAEGIKLNWNSISNGGNRLDTNMGSELVPIGDNLVVETR